MDLLHYLKLLGIAVTTGFGLYGLGIKLRTDTNALTDKGRVVLIGIITSGLITFLIQNIEYHREKITAKKEANNYQRLLESTLSEIYSTENARFDLFYEIPREDLATDGYLKRLSYALTNRGSNCPSRKLSGRRTIWECSDYQIINDPIDHDELFFNSESTLFPNKDNEPISYFFLTGSAFKMTFFKEKEKEDELWDHQRDIIFSINKYKSEAKYEYDGGDLEVRFENVPIENEAFLRTGILSLVQMKGGIVKLQHARFYYEVAS